MTSSFERSDFNWYNEVLVWGYRNLNHELQLRAWMCPLCRDVAAPGSNDSYGKFLTDHEGPRGTCNGMPVPLVEVKGLNSDWYWDTRNSRGITTRDTAADDSRS